MISIVKSKTIRALFWCLSVEEKYRLDKKYNEIIYEQLRRGEKNTTGKYLYCHYYKEIL